MSNKELARRAAAEICFAGVDISAAVSKYLISLTYTDNEEDETDDLQIKLEDRDGIWLEQWLNAAVQAAASSSSSTSGSGASSSQYKVTAKSGLNVRSGPGTSHGKLGALAYGATIDVHSIENGWASIAYSGKAAYVSASYITATGKSSATDSSGCPYGAGTGTVRSGSTGTDVKRCQWYLNKAINAGLVEDGICGPKTVSAIKAFQVKYGLTVDGICGPKTWAKLETVVSAVNSTKSEDTDNKGLKIQAVLVRENWNSDGKDKVLDCGEFVLDSVNASGPPSEVTIKCTSLPYNARIRQTKKSKSWEGYHLSGIVGEMAASNGMTCLYLSSYDPYYERLEQISKSDISFLSTLCHNAGISLKATNNILVLFDQATYEAKGAVATITKGDGRYLKYKLSTGSADTQYASCRVSYTNPGNGTVISAIAYEEDYDAGKDDNQQLEITAKVKSVGEAQALAEKSLRLKNKYEYSASFTMPGDPSLVAGVTITLVGWGPWSGKYIIKQAKHTLGSSGYTTQISLRRVLEGY